MEKLIIPASFYFIKYSCLNVLDDFQIRSL